MPRIAKRDVRLTQPFIRRNGSLEPCEWNEALDRAAGAMRSVIDRGTPTAFGMFSCSKTTNELNFAVQKFVRTVIGSNNIDSCNRT